MACVPGISKIITSTCETATIGGLEIKAWIGNRTEISPTYDVTNTSKVTSLAVEATKQLFPITGVKKLLDAGYDRVVAEKRPDKFKHFFNFEGFEFKTADVENLDSLDDLVVIVEAKDKTDDGDGVFRIYGLKYGLYPSSDTMRSNTENGARIIEISSQDGQEEPWSNYTLLATDYATTLALLVNLETPQA